MKSLLNSLARRGMMAAAMAIAVFCALPHLGVLVAALSGTSETLRHLLGTVLPSYTATTLALVAMVVAGTCVIGTGTAWLVTMTEFRGRRWLEVALVIPLAFPAYVLAYAYTHVLLSLIHI